MKVSLHIQAEMPVMNAPCNIGIARASATYTEGRFAILASDRILAGEVAVAHLMHQERHVLPHVSCRRTGVATRRRASRPATAVCARSQRPAAHLASLRGLATRVGATVWKARSLPERT
ncbi:hypothetical protein BN77_p2150045 [Rhizobium mesoamericanum STM3625]|uniref:Uncharacterized protein n=1 Tax=Rhizobium mesoamericanum STM3625 TaxID=1211777 RepID=K0PTE3_9HYPH|nr:hypothetical protein BN77_p2150045 [Rhizobium mesoamericanum STM3625]